MNIRTYTELISIPTFEERFRYLQLNGQVGKDTFGFDRYINQKFYRSPEWKRIRDHVIVRDNGSDLAFPGREISNRIIIHHMNPLCLKDFESSNEFLLNPEYLISTMHITHNAIHYGDEHLLIKDYVERSQNDTCPWKH